MRFLLLLMVYILFSTIPCDAQSLKNIPDITFCNTPYDYKYSYINPNEIGEIPPYQAENWEKRLSDIQRNYELKRYYGSITESTLTSLLEKSYQLYKSQSFINKDYYGKDTTFQKMLFHLYNAIYPSDSFSQTQNLAIAKQYYDHLSKKSINKAIGTIFYYRTNNILNYKYKATSYLSGDMIDSIAYHYASQSSNTNQDLANYYEVLGDFWYNFRKKPEKHTTYYNFALNELNKINTPISEIQRERIITSMYWGTMPGSIQSTNFQKVTQELINQLSSNIKEFSYHETLFKYLYVSNDINTRDEEDLTKLLGAISINDKRFLPIDCYRLLLNINKLILEEEIPLGGDHKVYQKEKFELVNESSLLALQLVCKNNMNREFQFETLYQSLFNGFLYVQDYRSAQIVNSFIGRLSEKYNEADFLYKQQVNKAYIDYNTGKKDSAKTNLLSLLNKSSSGIYNSTTSSIYFLLKTIASDEKNIGNYDYYNDLLKKNSKIDLSDSYLNFITGNITRERDQIDYELQQEINFQHLWGISNYSLATALGLLYKQSQTMGGSQPLPRP